MTTHPERDLDPAIRAARDLRATCDAWPRLVAALRPTRTTGSGRGVPGSRLPLDAHTSDVIAETTSWVRFWARILLDETTWTPPADDTPTLLRELADRVGHFTAHPDPLLAVAFLDETAATRRRVETITAPTGARKVPVHMACLEHPCQGQYTATIDPEATWNVIPDLRCTHDRKHVITPDELRRVQRWQQRRGREADPAAVRDYLAHLREHVTPALRAVQLANAVAARIPYTGHVRDTRRRGA